MARSQGRDIDLGPAAQEPDEHGVRKYCRDAVQAMRNTGHTSFVEEAMREESITHDEAVYLRQQLAAKNSAGAGVKAPGSVQGNGGTEAQRSDSQSGL